jgi:hypothetical protein
MSHFANELLMEMAREQMEEDKDWQEHTDYHNMSPRRDCPFCAQNADMPERDEKEEQYA